MLKTLLDRLVDTLPHARQGSTLKASVAFWAMDCLRRPIRPLRTSCGNGASLGARWRPAVVLSPGPGIGYKNEMPKYCIVLEPGSLAAEK